MTDYCGIVWDDFSGDIYSIEFFIEGKRCYVYLYSYNKDGDNLKIHISKGCNFKLYCKGCDDTDEVITFCNKEDEVRDTVTSFLSKELGTEFGYAYEREL